jgi:hypothetical protein
MATIFVCYDREEGFGIDGCRANLKIREMSDVAPAIFFRNGHRAQCIATEPKSISANHEPVNITTMKFGPTRNRHGKMGAMQGSYVIRVDCCSLLVEKLQRRDSSGDQLSSQCLLEFETSVNV